MLKCLGFIGLDMDHLDCQIKRDAGNGEKWAGF